MHAVASGQIEQFLISRGARERLRKIYPLPTIYLLEFKGHAT